MTTLFLTAESWTPTLQDGRTQNVPEWEFSWPQGQSLGLDPNGNLMEFNVTDRNLSINRSAALQTFEQNCTGGVRNRSRSALPSSQTIRVPPNCQCPNATQETCPCTNATVCGSETTCQTQVVSERNELVNSALEAEDYGTFWTQINQPHNDVHNQCGCIMSTGMDGMLIF